MRFGTGNIEEVGKIENALLELVTTGEKESAVTNLPEFVAKYGQHGARLLVESFIRAAPEFPGDVNIANDLAILMADLQSVLKNK